MDKDDDHGWGQESWLGIAAVLTAMGGAGWYLSSKKSASPTRGAVVIADLLGKRYVVTGANCGIGKATAAALAKRGADVVLAVRDVAAGEAARLDIVRELEQSTAAARSQQKLLVKHVDMSSFASIKAFASEELRNTEAPPLSALINNAGLMNPTYEQKHGFELTLLTNFYGPLYLTSLLIPKLRGGRVVNVGSRLEGRSTLTNAELLAAPTGTERDREKFSGADSVAGGSSGAVARGGEYSMWNAYSDSKHMMLLATRAQAELYRKEDVVVHSVTPGMVSTRLDRFVSPPLSWIYAPVKALFLNSPEQGAVAVVYAATADLPGTTTGHFWTVDKKAKDGCGIESGSARSQSKTIAATLLRNSLKRVDGVVVNDDLAARKVTSSSSSPAAAAAASRIADATLLSPAPAVLASRNGKD